MRCPGCQQENEESNLFCIFCGVDLTAEPPGEEDIGDVPPAEDTSDVSMAELQRQVQGLRQSIREIRATLASHDMSLSPRELRQLRPEVKPPPPREPAPDSASVSRRPPTVLTPSLGDESARPKEPPAPMPRERIQVDWEVVLGGNWLTRIGVLSVVIGTAFFLNLAFENKWIGETGRVVLGIVGGLAFIGASQYWHKRYPIYAQPLAGGGVALLYLTIFAAFAIYGLITLYPAIGLLLLISVASTALALRHESVALAIIGILGAFGAPFILGGFAQTSSDVVRAGPSIQLMTYVMVVDIGVLALSTFRNWRWFTLIALIGSLASFGSWHNEYGDSVSLLTSQGSLTIVFLIFVGATTLYHIIWRRAPEAFDHSLMVINAAAYFGISYGLLWDDFRPWMGGFTLLLSLFYGAIAYIAWVRSREHVYLSLMALGIALVFLTIAVPVQLGGPWISVAWAVEGAVLMWLSFRLGIYELRLSSIGVFGTMAVRALAFDTPVDLEDFRLILNLRMVAFGSGILALYLASYLTIRGRNALQEWEKDNLFRALLVGASFLTLWVSSAEVINAVDSGIVGVTGQTADSVKSLGLSLLWGVYASVVLVLGFVRGWRQVRMAGLGLLAVPILKLFLIDTFELERGYRIAAFLSLGGLLLVSGFLYQRYSGVIKGFLFEEEKSLSQS